MTSSINTNIAAFYAQANIAAASNAAQSSVSRLSSGNAIVQASDNVAGLATGTSLQTEVSVLKTAQTNAAQGSSLLQVADGALAQIQSILQQQQSLALQAGSGSLTDTDRGFLQQQFLALSNEINSLATGTNFNGVNLIDGSLTGGATVTSSTTANTAAAATGQVVNVVSQPAVGDTLTIDGLSVVFTNTPGTSGQVLEGADVNGTAANLASYLNNLHDPRFANVYFSSDTSGNVKANYTGGVLAQNLKLGAISTTAATGVFTGPAAAELSGAPDVVSITAAGGAGLGLDNVSALGSVTGSILANNGNLATNESPAIDVSNITGNANFIGGFGTGNIGQVVGTYSATDTASFTVQVGNKLYSAAATKVTAGSGPIALTFTDTANDSFTVNVDGAAITAGSITTQATLDPYTKAINQALSGVSFYQDRALTNYDPTKVTTEPVTADGVDIANLTGSYVTLNSNDASDFGANSKVQSVSVLAPTGTQTDAKITIVLNGDTYTSIPGTGTEIGLNSVITLQDQTNPNKTLSIVTGNTPAVTGGSDTIDINSQDKADALQTALQTAFQLGTKGGLSFQLGGNTSSNVSVSIGSATTTSLFNGNTENISTQAGASTAATDVGTALNTVTALRANAGALESQFNFASAALQSSVQNQTAAASLFLDTDISTESTSYATSQVKLQAGISVLAQANQQLQALLKLIG